MQIMLNFLSNGIKFTPRSGRITIGIEVTKRPTSVSQEDIFVSENEDEFFDDDDLKGE